MNSKLKFGSATGVAFAVGMLFMLLVLPHGAFINVTQNLGSDGRAINVVIQHADGTVFYNYTTHNVFTNLGGTLARNILGFNNITGYNTSTVIVMGNFSGTPAVTDTALTTEDTAVCTRSNGTTTVLNATGYQSQKQWATVSGAVTLNATALAYSLVASASNAIAIATISTATLIAGDTITTTWSCYTNSG
jgi:hypothetical protein